MDSIKSILYQAHKKPQRELCTYRQYEHILRWNIYPDRPSVFGQYFVSWQYTAVEVADIIQLLKDQNEEGLSLLYDDYAATLLGIITGIVKSKNIGEEILQQTLLKAWNNINSYDADKGNFFSWLAVIARNSAIDQVRLKGFQNHQKIKDLDNVGEVMTTPAAPSSSMDAQSLLASLEEKHQQVLDLVYLQGYSQRDAAEKLDIPLGTVKTRIRLGIATLRDNLKNEKNLFLGMLFLLTLLILASWI